MVDQDPVRGRNGVVTRPSLNKPSDTGNRQFDDDADIDFVCCVWALSLSSTTDWSKQDLPEQGLARSTPNTTLIPRSGTRVQVCGFAIGIVNVRRFSTDLIGGRRCNCCVLTVMQ